MKYPRIRKERMEPSFTDILLVGLSKGVAFLLMLLLPFLYTSD